MRIACPHCGERDVSEFVYHGDASRIRPEGSTATPDAMFDYVYLRDNPAGVMTEFWYHAQGCRSWLAVSRHTGTHEIVGVEPARAHMLKRKAAGL